MCAAESAIFPQIAAIHALAGWEEARVAAREVRNGVA
jgi:hypothetical protein